MCEIKLFIRSNSCYINATHIWALQFLFKSDSCYINATCIWALQYPFPISKAKKGRRRIGKAAAPNQLPSPGSPPRFAKPWTNCAQVLPWYHWQCQGKDPGQGGINPTVVAFPFGVICSDDLKIHANLWTPYFPYGWVLCRAPWQHQVRLNSSLSN